MAGLTTRRAPQQERFFVELNRSTQQSRGAEVGTRQTRPQTNGSCSGSLAVGLAAAAGRRPDYSAPAMPLAMDAKIRLCVSPRRSALPTSVTWLATPPDSARDGPAAQSSARER